MTSTAMEQQEPVTISLGKSITRKDDPLTRTKTEHLYRSIRNPGPELSSLINNLRRVQTIDMQRYRELKKRLPYIVCAAFYPSFRRTENFAFSNCFVLDLDHLHGKETTPGKVKELLSTDPSVLMAFTSPGGDGVKVIMKIDNRITEPMKFTLFYRSFAENFSRQYNMEQVIDKRTSDVTRACFLSHDPEIFYNPEAEPVNFNKWFNASDGMLPLTAKKIMLKDGVRNQPANDKGEEKEELPKELYDRIRKRLNPNARVSRPKQIYVPEEIEKITGDVIEKFREMGIEMKDVRNIHYGRKFIFTYGHKFAEINIFYGKRGYTVVRSMKNGSDPELLEIGYAIACDLFYGSSRLPGEKHIGS